MQPQFEGSSRTDMQLLNNLAAGWISKANQLKNAKTNTPVRVMKILTTGKCTGLREASVNGIRPPVLSFSIPLVCTDASARWLNLKRGLD